MFVWYTSDNIQIKHESKHETVYKKAKKELLILWWIYAWLSLSPFLASFDDP